MKTQSLTDPIHLLPDPDPENQNLNLEAALPVTTCLKNFTRTGRIRPKYPDPKQWSHTVQHTCNGTVGTLQCRGFLLSKY